MQRGQRPLLVRRRRPHAQLAPRRGQRVGEYERALLRAATPASVPRRGRRRARAAHRHLDRPRSVSSSVSGHVVAPEEARPERPRAVAADEQVHVAHVVGLEHHDRVGRLRVEARPQRPRVRRRRERVEHEASPARLDAGRGTAGCQSTLGASRMLQAPEPEARARRPGPRPPPAHLAAARKGLVYAGSDTNSSDQRPRRSRRPRIADSPTSTRSSGRSASACSVA